MRWRGRGGTDGGLSGRGGAGSPDFGTGYPVSMARSLASESWRSWTRRVGQPCRTAAVGDRPSIIDPDGFGWPPPGSPWRDTEHVGGSGCTGSECHGIRRPPLVDRSQRGLVISWLWETAEFGPLPMDFDVPPRPRATDGDPTARFDERIRCSVPIPTTPAATRREGMGEQAPWRRSPTPGWHLDRTRGVPNRRVRGGRCR